MFSLMYLSIILDKPKNNKHTVFAYFAAENVLMPQQIQYCN